MNEWQRDAINGYHLWVNLKREELLAKRDAPAERFVKIASPLFKQIDKLELPQKIETVNALRLALAQYSPFNSEPVDCIQWIPAENVVANDYNPNSVAPPEMELLRVSIDADGYTQPIVANKEGDKFVVVDGFHRTRIAKECLAIKAKISGHIPVVQIRSQQTDRSDRIASTIRHNRARGKHRIDAMSDIVVELKRRNWSDDRICKALGMEPDEVLRLCQITGLSELFSNQEFSKAWDVEGAITEEDLSSFADETIDPDGEDGADVRTANVSDPDRIFHTYDKWECHKAGFYASSKEGMTKEQCINAYRDFLSDLPAFRDGLRGVTEEWKHSCEHYLTNRAMNRIAWLGQAAMCYKTGIPSEFRSGFSLLPPQKQEEANALALEYLNAWLVKNGRKAISMEEALSGARQSDIY